MSATIVAKAPANGGGTALPIWRAISILLPSKTKSSGNPIRRAASRWVMGRWDSGCRYRPFSGLKNSVRIVTEGRSHHSRPNKSVPPDVFFTQQGGVSSGALRWRSKRFPPSGTARYRFRLTGVGVRPKCRLNGGATFRISVPIGSGKSPMASRTVFQRGRLLRASGAA